MSQQSTQNVNKLLKSHRVRRRKLTLRSKRAPSLADWCASCGGGCPSPYMYIPTAPSTTLRCQSLNVLYLRQRNAKICLCAHPVWVGLLCPA